jgi:hypothetical protein
VPDAGLVTNRRASMKIAFLSLCLLGIVAVVIANPDLEAQAAGVDSSGVSVQLIDCDCDCDD